MASKKCEKSPPQWNDVTYDDKGHVRTKAIHNYSPWLSNLYPYSKYKTFTENMVVINYNNIKFSSSEAAYQYAKAKFFDERLTDPTYLNSYPTCTSSDDENVISRHFPCNIHPLKAKQRGGKGNYAKYISSIYGNKTKASKLINEIMPHWYEVSMSIMKDIIDTKFDVNNPKFVSLLLQTNNCKIYETRGRGGSIWEKGGTKSGYGALGDMLMIRRKELLELQKKGEFELVDTKSITVKNNGNDIKHKRTLSSDEQQKTKKGKKNR